MLELFCHAFVVCDHSRHFNVDVFQLIFLVLQILGLLLSRLHCDDNHVSFLNLIFDRSHFGSWFAEEGTRWRFPSDGCKFCEALDLEQRNGLEAAPKSPTHSQWRGGANHMCSHQRQPENVDPTPTQLYRRHAGVWLVWKQPSNTRSRGGCSEERVVEGEASSPNTSIEGTACTERRVHPAFAEANASLERAEEQALLDKALVRHERLKQDVVRTSSRMQESGTEVLFFRKWPNWKRNESHIQSEGPQSLRFRLTKRRTGNQRTICR